MTMHSAAAIAGRLLAIGLSASIVTGCFDLERKSTTTAPTGSTSLAALLGNWSSSSMLPSAQSCSNFQWSVTEQTGTSASGTFSGTCPGGLVLAGSATGTLLGSTVSWTASGNATAPGLPACAFTLTGNAFLENDTVRVPYTGQTCLGPVSGEEVFKRR
jgi:hypothetical protein